MSRIGAGLTSGAVGTGALNIATYLDVALRGRPQSPLPAQAAAKLAEKARIDPLTGQSEKAENRRTGAGALMGYATGLTVGACYGLVRPLIRRLPVGLQAAAVGGLAMAASDVPTTRMGLTDPKEWSPAGWAADIVPHFLYGLATVKTYEKLAAR
ncbi:MAG TPA: hypothetical protein VM754_07825 [Actinomycetota bacterium]|nr:hypothetical protein [Actinomycetota bacterium]